MRYLSQPLFNSASMLPLVGTRDLNFSGSDVRAVRGLEPRIARGGQWIHRVGNHDATETKVVFGNCVTDAITRVVDGDDGDPGFPNG